MLACLLICLSAIAHAELAQEFMLKNGMTVIVKEDHRAPTAAHMSPTVDRAFGARCPASVGGFALRIDNNRKILDNIAAIGFYNLPLDYLDTWTANIAKVTTSEIKHAFNRKIAVDKLATVVVGAVPP